MDGNAQGKMRVMAIGISMINRARTWVERVWIGWRRNRRGRGRACAKFFIGQGSVIDKTVVLI